MKCIAPYLTTRIAERMPRNRQWLALAVIGVIGAGLPLSMLTGCAGTKVKDLGDGQHSVSACSDSGLTNPQVTAVRAADNYCGKFGQVSVVERFEPDRCPTAATSATALVFTCR